MLFVGREAHKDNNHTRKKESTQKMAQPSIHDVKAVEFKAMTPRQATDFLADVMVAWIPREGKVTVEDEIVLPDSYQVMFERRIKQLASLSGTSEEQALAKVLDAAVAKRDQGLVSADLVAV